MIRLASLSPARRLAIQLYAYAFLDDFILLYPFHALLFADTGLSTAQISSLRDLVAHRHPGAGSIRCHRRRRIAPPAARDRTAGHRSGLHAVDDPSVVHLLRPRLRPLGHGRCSSRWCSGGADLEELDRMEAADRYAHLIGGARALKTGASMVATAIAAPVMAVGGYPAIGSASVLACLAGSVVALTFPEHRVPSHAARDTARRIPHVRRHGG